MTTSADIEFAPRTQFDLKSLFGVMTVLAVALVPTYWFGASYLVTIFFSLVLYSLCFASYCSGSRGGAVVLGSVGLFVGFVFAIVSFVFFAHAFWNLVVCFFLVAIQVPPKVFGAVLGLVLTLVYAFAMYSAAGDLREHRSAMDRYPLISLESRLAFEKAAKADDRPAGESIVYATSVANHLDEQDAGQQSPGYGRQWALSQLHERTYRDFVFSPGFGFSRMPRFRPGMVELEPEPPLVMPWAIELAPPNAARSGLYDVHRTVVRDFLAPDRIGYARSRTEVAGFNAHHLTELRNLRPNTSEVTTKWQVSRLELVSLLRHAEPRVYVAKTMPAMDQLAEVPHRALNEFETRALRRLRAKQDVAVKQEPAHIEMLGAVRAGTSCLECHQVTRGTLLGAFSYEIVPQESAGQQSASAARELEGPSGH